MACSNKQTESACFCFKGTFNTCSSSYGCTSSQACVAILKVQSIIPTACMKCDFFAQITPRPVPIDKVRSCSIEPAEPLDIPVTELTLCTQDSECYENGGHCYVFGNRGKLIPCMGEDSCICFKDFHNSECSDSSTCSFGEACATTTEHFQESYCIPCSFFQRMNIRLEPLDTQHICTSQGGTLKLLKSTDDAEGESQGILKSVPKYIVNVLFLFEILFTLLKACTMASETYILRLISIVSFILESIIGVLLTTYVFISFVGRGQRTILSFIAAVLVLTSEVVTIGSESFYIYQKLKKKPTPNENHEPRQDNVITSRKYKLLFMIGSILSSIAILFSIGSIFVINRGDPEFKIPNRLVAFLVLAAEVVGILIATTSSLYLCLVVSSIILLIDLITSYILIWSGYFERFPGLNSFFFDVNGYIYVGVYLLVLASFFTAYGSIGLKRYDFTGEISKDQVYFLSSIAIMAGPASVIISTTNILKRQAEIAYIVVVPQIMAIIGPTLFAYVLGQYSTWKKRKQNSSESPKHVF